MAYSAVKFYSNFYDEHGDGFSTPVIPIFKDRRKTNLDVYFGAGEIAYPSYLSDELVQDLRKMLNLNYGGLGDTNMIYNADKGGMNITVDDEVYDFDMMLVRILVIFFEHGYKTDVLPPDSDHPEPYRQKKYLVNCNICNRPAQYRCCNTGLYCGAKCQQKDWTKHYINH